MRTAVLLLCSTMACEAATLRVPCTEDTTLSESYSLNNLGALPFANAGTTQSQRKNRALFRFELENVVPTGAQIRSVNLVLECTGVPDEPSPFSDFGLHRMLKPWGEGRGLSPTNCTSCAGQGSTALAGEACWAVPGPASTNTWEAPGASGSADYASAPSSTTTIYGIGDSPYIFRSSPALLRDIMDWVARPNLNFGWMLKCAAEDVPLTARRFGSRESTAPAYLELDVLLPPADLAIHIHGDEARLTFQTEPEQAYTVEMAPAPSGPWSTFTNLPPASASGTATITQPLIGHGRYYRVHSR